MQMNLDASESYVNTLVVANCNLLSRAIQGDVQRFELIEKKFCQLHFRGRRTLHKIGEFYLSDHVRQPQFGQNAILARSKAKIRNWKIINCFFY